jgi:hypothetical protein
VSFKSKSALTAASAFRHRVTNEFTKRKDTKLLYRSPLMYGWTAARPPTPHQ